MSSNNATVYEGTEYCVLYAMDVVELLSHWLLACPISALNFYLIFNTSVLHPNLKFILLCQSFCIFLRGFDRSFTLIIRLYYNDVAWSNSDFLRLAYLGPINFRNYLAHVLVIERLMATVLARCYERQRGPWFTICWLTIALSATILNLYWQAKTSDVLMLISYVSILTLAIVEILIFGCLWKYNIKSYRKKFGKIHDLSERFQLSENIRTAKQMIPPLIFHFLNVFISSVGSSLGVLKVVVPGQFSSDFMQLLLMILATFFSFMIEFTMIIYHPFLRRSLGHLWHRCLVMLCFRGHEITGDNRVYPNIGGAGAQPRQHSLVLMNIHGEALVQSVDQHAYFEMLRRSWEQQKCDDTL